MYVCFLGESSSRTTAGAMDHLRSKIIIATLLVLLSLVLAGSASSSVPIGMLVQIKNMSFRPDRISFPGDGFAVVVVQNREEAPILHEVSSRELLEKGTLVSVQGTGTIEYHNQRVSRILLYPGEEVVIWFAADKGRTYSLECNLNGHAMYATLQAT